MASHRNSVVHLYRAERRAIVLLRNAQPGETARDASSACFGAARARAEALGLVLLPIESDFVGDDEIRLLSWISALQAPKPQLSPDVDAALCVALRSCALHLRALGLRLPYRNAARTHRLGEPEAAAPAASAAHAVEALAAAKVSPRLTQARRLQLLLRAHGRTD